MASARSLRSTVEVAQSLHLIPCFGDCAGGLVRLHCRVSLSPRSAAPVAVRNRLEPEQQSMKALQQSVVQVPGNSCSLADSRLQRHLEIMMQLPDSQLVGRPQQC